MIQRYLIGILVLICMLKGAVAQENPSFAGFRAGVSIPFGKYHQKDLDGGGFALAGFNISAEGAWFFIPELGVGVSSGLNYHPVDVSMLGWEKVKSNPFLEDVTIRSDPYQMITAMAGPYLQLPLWKKLTVTGKLLVGLLHGKTPYQLSKSDYFFVGRIFEEKTSAKDWKFSWQTGIGFRFDISPCFGLVLDTDLFYDKLVFRFNTPTGIRDDEYTISFINTTIGIRFNL